MWHLLLAGLLGFVAGIAVNLIVPMTIRRVVVYPTPANVNHVVYQDAAGVCHEPSITSADCAPGAQPIPVQA